MNPIGETMTHIVYTLDPQQLNELKIGGYYTEIWRGLPQLPFRLSQSRGGELTFCYDGPQGYVWVLPAGRRAVQQDSHALLVASLKKTKKSTLNAWWVDVPHESFGNTLESAIQRAYQLNFDKLERQKRKDDE